MSHHKNFAIFVPATPTVPIARIVVPGSALVGNATNNEAEHVTVDYEGNIHGAANTHTFADRARHAADRQSERYPTIARSVVPRSHLRQVAWFDPHTRITLLDDAEAQKALASWLSVQTIDPKELRFSHR